ncbi:MAG TPA: translational GTPase TypA, partial [Firmicutes bacterium]|nr:translational GTPase TypA [Bacillota bacterium]
VFDLFVELEAKSWQLDFPIIYTSARQGIATMDPMKPGKDMEPLFELVKNEIPAPTGKPELPLQLQIVTLDYDDS